MTDYLAWQTSDRGLLCPSVAAHDYHLPMNLSSTPFSHSLPLVVLTTDGGCSPNPGPGAWAYVLRFGTAYKEASGACPETTNNRMELQAVIEGLRALKKPCRVIVRTDSKNTIAWCRPDSFRTWKKKLKHPEAFALVEEFRTRAARHCVTFEWVRGHCGDTDNERCDELCSRLLHSASPLEQLLAATVPPTGT